MKVAIILLAAGNSRRFGANKLFHPVDGKEMYKRTLETFSCLKNENDPQIDGYEITEFVIVTQYDRILEDADFFGAKAVQNLHPDFGISHSLHLGLQNSKEAQACLCAVCDQPWLTTKSVKKLLQAFVKSEKGIACMAEGEHCGNPCIFSENYYEELLQLKGDTGGKRVLRKHMEDVLKYQIENSRELKDLDTPQEI